METFRPFRIALVIYEFLRLLFTVGVFLVLQPQGSAAFPWLTLITPGALYLLMAFFWLLDISRYQMFYPLFLTGKGISLCSAAIWLFFAKSDMIKTVFMAGQERYLIPGIAFFLITGDLLSGWITLKIFSGNNK